MIILTSNVGATYLTDMGEGPVRPETRQMVMAAIQATWPPEFINRLDEILIFRSLSRANVRQIVDIRLQEVQARLSPRKMVLDLDDEAKNYLASIGYSPTYGARPLNRAIQTELLNPLSILLLEERVRDGESVRVRFDGPRNRLQILPNHEAVSYGEGMDVDEDDDDELQIEEMD